MSSWVYWSRDCDFVKRTWDLTISPSGWRTFHPTSTTLPSGTTLCVVGTREPYLPELQSACSVPVRPEVDLKYEAYILAHPVPYFYYFTLITYTTPVSLVLYLQCTCGLPAYRYLIVQFPLPEGEPFNFCELEVYIRRKLFFFNWQRAIACQ